jgi:hypothetical protein
VERVITGQKSAVLGAEVRDATMLVASEKDDIIELKGLTLRLSERKDTDGAAAVWAQVTLYETLREEWRDIGSSIDQTSWERVLGDLTERAEYGGPLSAAQEAALLLGTILEFHQREVIASDSGATALRLGSEIISPLFFASARPSLDGDLQPEVLFDEFCAALVLQPGSRIVRLVAGGVFKFLGWASGFAPRFHAAEAAATDITRRLREQRERQALHPLLRLDQREPLGSKLRGKRGALVFLHGLLSTDLGTFDGFISRWLNPAPSKLPQMARYATQRTDRRLPAPARQEIEASVALIGWPHDTLVKINKNAEDLALLIDRELGSLDCPIAFICHSRGGLVARAVAEKLFDKNPSKWLGRICWAMTFGTPHDGAEFAEHPDVGLGAFLLAGSATKGLAGIFDALVYVRQRQTLDGILDLRPRGASGPNFLEDLFEKEFKSCESGPRRLPITAIGGRHPRFPHGDPLLRRLARAYTAAYTGEEENDLVVTSASATAADTTGSAFVATNCDHFGYFALDQCRQPHMDTVIYRLWESFGLAGIIGPTLAAASQFSADTVGPGHRRQRGRKRKQRNRKRQR